MVDDEVSAQSPSVREGRCDADPAARFEREAFPLLDSLYRGALWLTGDRREAEDLLREAMMNAYKQIGSLPENTNLRTLLYRALTNAYISSCRTRHRQLVECPTAATTGRQPPPTAAHSSMGLRVAQLKALEALAPAAITEAFQALQRDIRMAVYYADVEGFCYREIGEITNRSISAVALLVRRGRHQLRDLLLAALREPTTVQLRKAAPKDTAPTQAVPPKHAPPQRLPDGDTHTDQDCFDREIVRYVLLWARHGEMWDEDVYPAFGMTVEQLLERFHRIVGTSAPGIGRLAESDRERARLFLIG